MLPSMLKGAIETSQYRDLRFKAPKEKVEDDIHKSTTLYVGNLSFYTTEEQIYELFSRCGEIKRIIMGLDKFRRTPCGFCFVEYYTRADAQACVYYINGSRLDDRMIRVDWDAGFKEGRQYGRGKSGGQVRDEYRTDYDPGRGGYGKIVTSSPIAAAAAAAAAAGGGPNSPMLPLPSSLLPSLGGGFAHPQPPPLLQHLPQQHQFYHHHQQQQQHHQQQHQSMAGFKRPRDEGDFFHQQQHSHNSAKRPRNDHHHQHYDYRSPHQNYQAQQHHHHQSSRSSNPRFRERNHDSDEED